MVRSQPKQRSGFNLSISTQKIIIVSKIIKAVINQSANHEISDSMIRKETTPFVFASHAVRNAFVDLTCSLWALLAARGYINKGIGTCIVMIQKKNLL